MCKQIRPLKAEEVEVRVAQGFASGFQALLYKNARVDKQILDETFGMFGWQNRYEVVNNDLYCTILIRDKETGQWIAKQDCGLEGNVGEGKSTASDAFKRAGFAVGIGRELYTKIFIYIPCEMEANSNGKGYHPKDKYATYTVTKMEVNEDTEKIVALEICDKDGKCVFTYPKNSTQAKKTASAPKAEAPKTEAPKTETPKAEPPKAETPKAEAPKAEAPKAEDGKSLISGKRVAELYAIYGEQTPILCRKYKVNTLEELTNEQYDTIMAKLNAYRNKVNENVNNG